MDSADAAGDTGQDDRTFGLPGKQVIRVSTQPLVVQAHFDLDCYAAVVSSRALLLARGIRGSSLPAAGNI